MEIRIEGVLSIGALSTIVGKRKGSRKGVQKKEEGGLLGVTSRGGGGEDPPGRVTSITNEGGKDP